jgi:hypothetical protein
MARITCNFPKDGTPAFAGPAKMLVSIMPQFGSHDDIRFSAIPLQTVGLQGAEPGDG